MSEEGCIYYIHIKMRTMGEDGLETQVQLAVGLLALGNIAI